MGIVHFVKTVGEQLGLSDNPPTAGALKKALDSYDLGTEKVSISVKGDKAVLKGSVADRATLEKAVIAVGNIFGISAVDTTHLRVREPNSTSEITNGGHLPYYIVKKNDNLQKIAEKIYGKDQGDKSSMIFEANKPILTSPHRIYFGQVIRIPVLNRQP